LWQSIAYLRACFNLRVSLVAIGQNMPTDISQPSGLGGPTRKASTIDYELLITGNVMSSGDIHLDGQVQGDIHCVALVLGENAQLEGSAIAEDVVIRGRLIGSVRALRVSLQSTSHVEGDLFYQSLAIEKGAYFEGKSRQSDDPLSREYALPLGKLQLVSERPEQGSDSQPQSLGDSR
jgi:cytoskeletal protein CcmA (bactofilin family)